MVTFTINGKMVTATEGEMLLAAIKREGLDVPSTCDHKAVEPYGACRLCTVEITRTEWDGWKKHVTSCLYPVEDGLIVSTHTEEVIKMRKTILDLYLARSPKAEYVRELAAQYGVMQTSFEEVPDGDDCILCALCTRVCDAMGFHAISTVNRGHGKAVAPPLGDAPPDCVGCLACAQVCPTNFIKFTDDGLSRTIWDKKFELIACEQTGKPTITREFADYLSNKRDIPKEYFKTGDETDRIELARLMGKIAQWQRQEEQS